jgi:cation-transporting ATPase 13A1
MIFSMEAGTAFSRKKNLNTLKGMAATAFDVMVYRSRRWLPVASSLLLPGDIISLRRLAADGKVGNGYFVLFRITSFAPQTSHAIHSRKNKTQKNGTVVPCDCLILRGTGVANESSLTGESVPQLRDAIRCGGGGDDGDDDDDDGGAATSTAGDERRLQMRGDDSDHVLYSGTLLIQHSSGDDDNTTAAAAAAVAAATAKAKASNIDGDGDDADAFGDDGGLDAIVTPDGGCLCYVLRTGFNSSQGELMRMIEFSTQKVAGDTKETLSLLLLLLVFALMSAGYVLKTGLEEGKQTKYKLLLRCVQILTSVVPPELPMQAGLAVNTALMALLKAGVFCTEPFRVPLAGRLTHCLFDKTGTLTTDQLECVGVINASGSGGGGIVGASTSSSSSGDKVKVSTKKDVKNDGDKDGGDNDDDDSEIVGDAVVTGVRAIEDAALDIKTVVAGCHSLMQVDGEMFGDTIETAALAAVHWSYDAAAQTAHPGVVAKLKATAVAAVAAGANAPAPAPALPEPTPTPTPEEVAKNVERAAKRAAKNADAGPSAMRVTILHRFRFSSALQRMATVVSIRGSGYGQKKDDTSVGDGTFGLVKGSPEAISLLLKLGGKPQWYEASYRRLAKQGMRVLAFAFRRVNLPGVGGGEEKKLTAAASRLQRDTVECDLTFAGFIAFRCRLRKDSKAVIRSLTQSAHTCSMLTGDAPFTALHIADAVTITRGERRKTLMLTLQGSASSSAAAASSSSSSDDGAELVWRCALDADDGVSDGEAVTPDIPFVAADLPSLARRGFDLVVSGAAFEAAVVAAPDVWRYVQHIQVFARLTPRHKQRVIEALKENDADSFVLMCGDGGNDVGALKAADVGLALLSGFGNVNTEKDDVGGKGDAKGKEGAADKGGVVAASDADAEAALAKHDAEMKAKQTAASQASLKKRKAEWEAKRKEITGKQQVRNASLISFVLVCLFVCFVVFFFASSLAYMHSHTYTRLYTHTNHTHTYTQTRILTHTL